MAKEDYHYDRTVTYFLLGFRQLCIVTVSLPLFALFTCFITAYIFQADDIHEDHCKVYNIIPSISAITGISPQKYLWRICVALHIGPRFIIAASTHNYHKTLMLSSDYEARLRIKKWLNIAYLTGIIEICSLCGVTYISNRENYPVHEKIFIIFMISSLTHMLASVKCGREIQSCRKSERSVLVRGLRIKEILFAVSMVSTLGLVVFFLKHRLFCHDMAFSWFAFCEYVIASSNMAFHMTIVLDLPTQHLMVANTSTGPKTSQPVGWKLK